MSDQAHTEAPGESQGGAAPPPAADNANGDIEVRARQMGWRPREEFRGPDNKWVDAAEFVERGENWVPYLQERNRYAQRQMEAQQKEIDELKSMVAEGNDRLRRSEQIGYKRAMRELEQRKAEAISNADPQEVRRIDQEIQELGPEPKPAAPTAQQQAGRPAPEVVEWVDNNPWVKATGRAWRMAVEELTEVQRESPMLPLADALAEVKKRIMPLFVRDTRRDNGDGADDPPARRNNPPPVNRSSSVSGRSRAAPRSFEAMPENVKAQYVKEQRVLEGKGQPLTKEEYASYYWEQFPEEG
jgi:hypothetical protein